MNQTKILILSCLADFHWRTSSEVAEACGLSLTNSSELLRRYRSQSLVNRERNYGVPRGYVYRITQVGLDRLYYLTADVVRTSTSIADHVGLRGNRKRVFDQWVEQKLGR